MDGSGRIFCTYECAWTVLFFDEQRATVLEPAAPAPQRRTKTRSSRGSAARRPPATPAAPPPQKTEWHAMLGMTALLGLADES